jgi:hypothetical protein
MDATLNDPILVPEACKKKFRMKTPLLIKKKK